MKKKENITQLRDKKIDNLNKMLGDEYKKLQQHRFSLKFRNLKDISQINKTKKSIAQILTIIREKLNNQ